MIMTLIYFLTAIGLTPGGSSTVQYSTHLHTNSTQNNTMKQNTQRRTYIKIRIYKYNNKNTFFITMIITLIYLLTAIELPSGGSSTVQYITVHYSTLQYSTLQYITVQYSRVQYSTVQYSTVQYTFTYKQYIEQHN